MNALHLLFAGALAGCQFPPERPPENVPPPPHSGVGPGAGAGTGAGGGMGATASSMGEKAGSGSWYGMCALNQQIEGAGTAEERRAMLDKAFPDMLPDARERQLETMQQSCR